MSWLDRVSTLPYSTILILFINFGVVLVSSYAQRRMIDFDRLDSQEAEVRRYERRVKDQRKRGDKAALRKLRRQELRIKRLSSAASRQRLKAIILTALPFIVISFFLSTLYLGKEVVVFPFEFVLFTKELSFSVWYFLTYFMAYLPVSKILRTSPGYWERFEGKSG